MSARSVLFAPIGALLACSSSSATGSSAADGGGYTSAPTVNESAAPTCNDAPEVASAIPHTGVSNAFPSYTATGGTIGDGVYTETSNTTYGFSISNPETDATTVIVKGSSWYIANQGNGSNSDNGEVIHDTRTAGTAGSTLTFLATCTQSSIFTGSDDFSATDSGFTLYDKTQQAVIQFTRK